MLGAIVAAEHPKLVRKLVLVSSGPFDPKYADAVTGTRRARLTRDAFERGDFAGADAYDPIEAWAEIGLELAVFQDVWAEASYLRSSGGLLAAVARIRCPVVAIHGDHDPHPAEGVREPLSRLLDDFTFHLLDRCGHEPWNERHARDGFFELLTRECRL
jgi:pimeloyl-ACP methyl ester carboxylesterase